jgi:2-succinyl-6-hydroxy-2,4-cyclohexadiene-1-carboxylate synthase
MNGATGHDLAVHGVTLHVEHLGAADSAAQTLVLLHGFTGSAASWGTRLATFAAAGLRVIAFDLLGHGSSSAPDDPERYRMERCQEDMGAALELLGVGPGEAILLGYSMGGRLALYLGFSGYFRAMILESASPGLASASEREERRASDERLAASIERDGIAAFVDFWERLPLFASLRALPEAMREQLHAQRLQNRPVGLANSLRGMGTGSQPALHERLPALELPVLLLAGELDTKFCDIARQMHQALPHASLEIVPAAGHTIHLEQPEQFDKGVLAFCQAHPDTASQMIIRREQHV